MNTNLLNIVKQITVQNGESILGDPARLKPLFANLAKNEPKPLRIAFGRCIEAGAYNALKTAPNAAGRIARKTTLAQNLRNQHGIDPLLCGEALDILEAALFGTASAATLPVPLSMPAPAQFQQAQYQPPSQPSYQIVNQIQMQPTVSQTHVQPTVNQIPVQPPVNHINAPPPVKSGGLWTAVLVCNILGFNWISRFITGHIGTGILVLLLDIVTVATLSAGLGWVLSVVCLIIYVVDLVKIGTKKWQIADGTCLVP